MLHHEISRASRALPARYIINSLLAFHCDMSSPSCSHAPVRAMERCFADEPSARPSEEGPSGRLSSAASLGQKLPSPGTTLEMRRVFTQDDVDGFAWMTGDMNPLHSRVSSDMGLHSRQVEGHIVPGILLASMFPAIIGSSFPGSIYASQTLKFKAPCPVGSEVVARVVLERSMGRMAKFRTTCAAVRGSDPGSVMVEGEAFAQMP